MGENSTLYNNNNNNKKLLFFKSLKSRMRITCTSHWGNSCRNMPSGMTLILNDSWCLRDQELSLVGWRVKRTYGVVSVWVKGLRTRRVNGVNPGLKTIRLETQEEKTFQYKSRGKKKPLSQLKGSQAGLFPSDSCERDSLFVLSRPSSDWMRSVHIKECNLLYSVHWFKC